MREIPPEIDDLLWHLAEEGGPTARAEFESRHARFGPELSRRVQMVAQLREAGRTVVHRPKFTPRPARTVPMPRWAVGGAIGLGALAIGAVAYVAVSSGERPLPPPAPIPVRTAPIVLPPPVVQAPPLDRKPPLASEETPKVETTPKYLLPRNVRIADTSLTAAIRLVAAGGGLQVTVAPGFEDQRVSLDYRDLNTMETLKAMAGQYGFSVLEEQEGHVLVVPARDEGSRHLLGP